MKIGQVLDVGVTTVVTLLPLNGKSPAPLDAAAPAIPGRKFHGSRIGT
jgi:hypothetical protein